MLSCAPKDAERHLPDFVLGWQRHVKPQDGITHPHSLSCLPRSYRSHSQKWPRHCSYLFPRLSWRWHRQPRRDQPQKINLLTKVLGDANRTEIPPHPYPNEARVCPVYRLNQEKMVQFLPSASHLFLLPNTMASNFNLWKACHILAVAISLIRTEGGMKSLSYCK